MGRGTVGLSIGLIGAALLVVWPWVTGAKDATLPLDPPGLPTAEDGAPKFEPPAASGKFPVETRYPASTPGVATGLVDIHGRSITVACEVCHSLLKKPSPATLGLTDLKDFHRGMEFQHGRLTCLSCHDPANYRSFRLADGSPVEQWDTIELCSQCHGPQRTDFDHGAHGGMTGYWDLSRGPRIRNACTGCHAPHSPAVGRMLPTFKPRDRFLSASEPPEHPAPEEIQR